MKRESATRSPLNSNLTKLVWFRGLLFSNIFSLIWILFLTRTLHMQKSEALVLISFGILVSGALEVPTGWFADRYGHKLSLLLGAGICVGGVVVLATAVRPGPYLVFGVAAENAGAALCGGADSAMAADTCAELSETHWEETYSKLNIRMFESGSLGRALGGLVGGAGAWALGLRAVLWLQVVANLALFGVACSVHSTSQQNREVRHLGRIAWSLRRRPELSATIALTAIGGGLAVFIVSFLPLYCGQVMFGRSMLSFGLYGLLWAAYMGSMWAFSKFGRKPFSQWCGNSSSRMLVRSTVIGTLGLVVMGLTVSPIGLVAVFAIFFMRPMQQKVLNPRTMALANKEERATIASIARFGMVCMAGAYAWLMGIFIAHLDLAKSVLATAVLFACLSAPTLIMWVISRQAAPMRASSAG
jgi:MFS family permease